MIEHFPVAFAFPNLLERSLRDVSRQLLNSGYIVPGFRRSEKVLERLLDRYIPIVASLGGFLVGVLAAAADVAGAHLVNTVVISEAGVPWRHRDVIADAHAIAAACTCAGRIGNAGFTLVVRILVARAHQHIVRVAIGRSRARR